MRIAPNAYWRTLRKSPTRAEAWLDLARHYADRKLSWQAAYAARQASRFAPRLKAGIDSSGLVPVKDTAGDDNLLG